MTKTQAAKIIDFIRHNYDMVRGQEEWFDFCEILFDAIEHDMNASSWGIAFAKENPDFFKVTVKA